MTYPGGKGRLFRPIINRIPPHDCYIEAFAGGGSVIRHKKPAQVNIAIDKSHKALRFLVLSIPTKPPMPAPIPTIADGISNPLVDDSIPTIADVSSHQTNPTPKPPILPCCIPTIADGISNPAWYFLQGDALKLLPSMDLPPRTFIYLDPPYLLTTRKQQRPLYEYEFSDPDQHKALLCLAKALVEGGCNVAISSYESELYADSLSGWRVDTFTTTTRGNSLAVEWLWMSYPEPKELHDYQWLGETFREREGIRDRRKTIVGKLGSMGHLERLAAIEEIERKWG